MSVHLFLQNGLVFPMQSIYLLHTIGLEIPSKFKPLQLLLKRIKDLFHRSKCGGQEISQTLSQV